MTTHVTFQKWKKKHYIDDRRCKVKWYERTCSFVSSRCLSKLYPLNQENKINCDGSFLSLFNLEGPNIVDEFEAMMIEVQVVKLHFQIQGVLMFSTTKSQSEIGPKKQSYGFQKDLRWVAWKEWVRIVKVEFRHFTKAWSCAL